MSSYSKVISNLNNIGTSNVTGQQVPRKGHENIMVKNNAGGYTYTISDEDLIDRILVLGTSSNTYYSSAEKLTQDSINSIHKMISNGKGQMIVDHVKSIYENGRAPKQDPTFFVLALLTQSNVPIEVRKNALQIISQLRTFTQLYLWVSLKKQLANGHKGFGRATRNALYELFKNKTGLQLVYQTSKYNSRKIGTETWTIADVIKCAHVPSKCLSPSSQIAVAYMINGLDSARTVADKYSTDLDCKNVIQYLQAVETVKSSTCSSDIAVQFIRQYNLPRETLSTHLLNHVDVWKALLGKYNVATKNNIQYCIMMPITALIRNLGVMTSKGVFNDKIILDSVVAHLNNQTVLKKGRVHPVALLQAKIVYQQEHGFKGKLNWTRIPEIVNALDSAFYLAFGNIKGTGKKILHAIDCSGSMSSPMSTMPLLSSCQAVATLVMEAIKREYKYHQELISNGENSNFVQDVVIFKNSLTPISISPSDPMESVLKKISDNNFGSTDCALPMIHALNQYKTSNGKFGIYDCFIVYTDNETYYGNVHPYDALEKYRNTTGIDAKMVVVATTSTKNSIGFFIDNKFYSGSNDNIDTQNALNIAGFDLNGPTLIREFLQGTDKVNNCVENIENIIDDTLEYDIVDDV